MKDLIEQYLITYRGRLKPSTLNDYRSILSLHLAQFSTFEELNQGLEPYLSGLLISGKRKNNILTTARSLISWARRRRLWEGEVLPVPRFPHRSRKTRPLTPEEVKLVMDFAPMPYRDFFRVSILSGLRTGEALGLKFSDFDLGGKVIKVERTLSGGKVVTTKTLSGDREIPLLRPLWEIYQSRQRHNSRNSPWFFYSETHGLMSLGALRKAWKVTLDVFEIEARPLYATRHTFATLALAAGEDPLWVAQVMGHARPDQLFLRYASYLKGVKPDGEKLLNLVGHKTLMRAIT